MSDTTGTRIVTEKPSSDAVIPKEKRSMFPNSGIADKIQNKKTSNKLSNDMGLDLSSDEEDKTPPPVAKKKGKQENGGTSMIEINVIDPNPDKKKKETFTCEKNLLL